MMCFYWIFLLIIEVDYNASIKFGSCRIGGFLW